MLIRDMLNFDFLEKGLVPVSSRYFAYDFPLFFSCYTLLANSVNAKCRPSKLIAIPFCKIITDALGQGAHRFASFFIINIQQIIV